MIPTNIARIRDKRPEFGQFYLNLDSRIPAGWPDLARSVRAAGLEPASLAKAGRDSASLARFRTDWSPESRLTGFWRRWPDSVASFRRH